MLELEHKLLDAAMHNLEYADDVLPGEMPIVSTDHAISLLTIHRRQLAGNARRGGKLYRVTEEEACKAILHGMEKLHKREERAQMRAEKVAALRG